MVVVLALLLLWGHYRIGLLLSTATETACAAPLSRTRSLALLDVTKRLNQGKELFLFFSTVEAAAAASVWGNAPGCAAPAPSRTHQSLSLEPPPAMHSSCFSYDKETILVYFSC